MLKNSILGYFWMTLGCFIILFFASKLLLQILALIFGIICITKGLKFLSMDRAFYAYSKYHFYDSFIK
jgi:c-di-AMP phosphodiesterase-like protein